MRMSLHQRGKRGIYWIDVTIAGERIARSAGTSNRSAAEDWAAQLAHDTWRTRKPGDTPNVSWGRAVLDWLSKHGSEHRSIEAIKNRLRWLTKHLEKTPLSQVSRSSVETLMQRKLADSVTPATCNRDVSEVSKRLNHAHRLGWLAAAPPLRHYAEPRHAVRWLTRRQAQVLLDALPVHLENMARLALATGLRESSVRRLRWDQIDFGRKIAWIESADMKSGKPFNIPLNADALEVRQRCRYDHAQYVFEYRRPAKKCSDSAGGEGHHHRLHQPPGIRRLSAPASQEALARFKAHLGPLASPGGHAASSAVTVGWMGQLFDGAALCAFGA